MGAHRLSGHNFLENPHYDAEMAKWQARVQETILLLRRIPFDEMGQVVRKSALSAVPMDGVALLLEEPVKAFVMNAQNSIARFERGMDEKEAARKDHVDQLHRSCRERVAAQTQAWAAERQMRMDALERQYPFLKPA